MKTLAFTIYSIAWTSVFATAQVPIDPFAPQPARPNYGLRRELPPEVTAKMNAEYIPTNRATKVARALLAQKKYRQAEAECKRAIALSPRVGGYGRNGVRTDATPFNSPALILLGEIYLAQGRNEEALVPLLSCYSITGDTVLDLDVALAYCRLGKEEAAKRFYSDDVILRRYNGIVETELPGTRSLRTLEASILFARGLNVYSNNPQEGLENYSAAYKLVPNNGLIAFEIGRAFFDLERYSEALPYYRTAIRCLSYRSKLLESAKEREMNCLYSLKLQQEAQIATPSATGKLP